MSIPSEITDVMRRFPGYSICVKGPPGSGKTAFALTLLHKLCSNGNGLYVSTRVEPRKVYNMFPWTREAIPPSGVVDAVNTTPQREGNLVENLRYATMPEFIEAIYNKITKLEDPILSIDSWDAVAQATKESSEDLHNIVLDLASETGTRLVLITETSEQTSLDYMVDGVVELGFAEMGQDVSRFLQIRKLRGTEHDLRKYLLMISDKGLEVKGLLYE